MNKSIKYLIPAVMALTLVACGGSSSKSGASYSGKSDPANFSSADTATKTQIGNDSATVISEAVGSTDADGFLGGFPMGVTTQDSSKLQSKAQKYINISLAQASQAKAQDSTLSSLPVGASESVTIPCSSGEMVLTINGKGKTLIEESFYFIHIIDWASLFLADMIEIDPVEVKVIDYLKNTLDKV